ncbi:protein starmaker [Labrus mixtus]|uniref:protein starmaker n=1 Tax=Labrus mixtus TaxID=508554 RepID=UPI0029C0DC66|nr:protein starmaker [Labrus mixtus]
MGQNQDKLGEGEPAQSEGLEEARPSPESGDAGSHTGDVMEGGSSCEVEEEEEEEEEAGSNRKNSGEPDAQDLEGSPGQEPTTPSSEKHINPLVSPFAAREVRQGGAAGKEEGGGGGGGRTVPLVPQETHKNLESSERTEERANTHKPFNRVKREKKKKEEEPQKSSEVTMENHEGGTIAHEEERGENFSAGVSEERYGNTAKVKMGRFGAHAGSDLLPSVHRHEKDAMMDEDIKLCARTVGLLSERKEPPSAQSQHPLENSVQKESLLDMSDTIHCGAPTGKTEDNTKEETAMCEVEPSLNDSSSTEAKITGDQRESARPYVVNYTIEDSTNQMIESSNPEVPAEPGSILEKLLKRNRKEVIPDLSEMKEVDVTDKKNMNEAARHYIYSAATEPSSDQIYKSDVGTRSSAGDMESLAEKDLHIKELDLNQTDADERTSSDVLCFQPSVISNAPCESSHVKSRHSKAHCLKSEKKITSVHAKPEEKVEEVSPSENLPSDRSLSAVSHEEASCEAGGVTSEESAPFSMSEEKSPPTKRDDSSHLFTSQKTDNSTVGPPLQIKSDSDSKADPQSSDSASSQDQCVRKREVKNSTEDKTQAVETGSVYVEAVAGASEESNQLTADMKQDLHTTLNSENIMPEQPDSKPGEERGDTVVRRDNSQRTSRSRPVSDLIKESIQLHEKLQHQERPKPAEVKCDEQGQSVKVAQMKAAFDTAQKSPEKGVERKPSIRKGKSDICCKIVKMLDTLILSQYIVF